jgi:hypothetical protein
MSDFSTYRRSMVRAPGAAVIAALMALTENGYTLVRP